jgi:peptide/nickel transport system substrate-binding protein
MRLHNRLPWPSALAGCFLLVAGCERPGGCSGDYCGTVVFSSFGQISTLLPVVSDAAEERDIFDQIFLKLADLSMDGFKGDSGFVPQLARSWEWSDPLTLTFHLDPRARWQDGQPVTANDVAFTFDAYTDTAVGAPDMETLARIAAVTAADSLTAVVRFRDRYPEMLFDAVYHMRILPQHLLAGVPRADWRTAAFGRAPVGDGPYRFVRWAQDQSVELDADSGFFLGRPHIRRLIWRFSGDPGTAITQVIAGDADAIHVLITPDNVERARQAQHLAVYPYQGSVYTFVGFNLRAPADSTKPHPILADPVVRRALVLATDRSAMLKSVLGAYGAVPAGPMSKLWPWLWVPELTPPPYDTAQAGRLLGSRGWRDSNGDGIRDRAGKKLGITIIVPTSSGIRRQFARLLQEQLRAVGVELTLDEMDNQAFSDKLHASAFDAALESWQTDPTPSSSVTQFWGRGGGANFGHYADPAFDRQAALAISEPAPDRSRADWIAAFKIIAQDAPGIMLAALDNVAAVDRRITDVQIRPDSWWALVRNWRIPPDRLIERDRVER